ncbi:MAG: hypothetical protein IMW89_18260 [Ktedonobacteraceae bacterium]|nr:hypothetical protein [Ktedonobacteraceae bacterium]
MTLLSLLAACGTTVTTAQVKPTPTIDPAFQRQLSPVPSPPAYRCGAWASNNAPSAYSTITIYARLMRDLRGVSGAPATAVVHFKYGDLPLNQQSVSDSGGYVSFTLQLQGRQPRLQPATVDVAFSINGQTIQCTPAFFTPM